MSDFFTGAKGSTEKQGNTGYTGAQGETGNQGNTGHIVENNESHGQPEKTAKNEIIRA